MRIPQIIGSWLIMTLVYSIIAGLTLCAVLLVKHYLSPEFQVPPFWVLSTCTLYVGMVAAVPGFIANMKKYRRGP